MPSKYKGKLSLERFINEIWGKKIHKHFFNWYNIFIFLWMPSSVISYIDYKPGSKSLIIKFVSGMLYRYKNVPSEEYDNFKKSTSKGIYFNNNIKGVYEFEKVEENSSHANQPKYKKKE